MILTATARTHHRVHSRGATARRCHLRGRPGGLPLPRSRNTGVHAAVRDRREHVTLRARRLHGDSSASLRRGSWQSPCPAAAAGATVGGVSAPNHSALHATVMPAVVQRTLPTAIKGVAFAPRANRPRPALVKFTWRARARAGGARLVPSGCGTRTGCCAHACGAGRAQLRPWQARRLLLCFRGVAGQFRQLRSQ